MENSKLKIAILGAGPAGLTTAYLLRNLGHDIHVFDKSQKPGGLASSIKVFEEEVEIGPHYIRYHGNPVTRKILKVLFKEDEILKYKRKSSIHLNGKFYNYPPRIKEFIKKVPFHTLVLTSFSKLIQSIKPNLKRSDAYASMNRKIGSALTKLFFKDYSEKLWGMELPELDRDYAECLIPFKGINKLFRKAKKKRGLEHYINFKSGIGELCERIFEISKINGVRYHLGKSILSMDSSNGQIKLKTEDKVEFIFDQVYSSLPLDFVFDLLRIKRTQAYKYRAVSLVYIKAVSRLNLDEQCLYLYDKNIKAVRLTNFDAFPGKKRHVILLEYWNDPVLAKNLDESDFLEFVKRDLKLLSIEIDIKRIEVKTIFNAYRIPSLSNYDLHDEKLKTLAKVNNLSLFGRNATMTFNFGIDRAMMDAGKIYNELNAGSIVTGNS